MVSIGYVCGMNFAQYTGGIFSYCIIQGELLKLIPKAQRKNTITESIDVYVLTIYDTYDTLQKVKMHTQASTQSTLRELGQNK